MRTLRLTLALALIAGCGPAPVPVKPKPTTEEAPPAFQWTAFPRVDILDASYLVLPADLAQTEGVESALAAAGVPADQIAGVLSGAEETAWPAPFADADARYYANAEIALMRTRQVAYLDPDKVIVAVLADENQHLKPDARPQHDFFAVFVEWGVQPIDPVPARPGEQLEPGKFPAVTIVDPDRLFPYAGVRYLEQIDVVLRTAGVPDTAFEAIYNRSEEIGWPRGLRWDRRPANSAAISGYKARKIAEIGPNVLLLIAASENQHMPDGLRPTYDFYFLVDSAGVSKKK